MIIATRYATERVEGADAFRIRNHDAPLCPDCGVLCSGYDTRPRRVIRDDGQSTDYRLRRVRCPDCGVIHIELPDFMRPRKRYAAAVIDDVLTGGGDCCPADEKTMWRWRRENHPPEMPGVLSATVVQSEHKNAEGDKPCKGGVS